MITFDRLSQTLCRKYYQSTHSMSDDTLTSTNNIFILYTALFTKPINYICGTFNYPLWWYMAIIYSRVSHENLPRSFFNYDEKYLMAWRQEGTTINPALPAYFLNQLIF